MPSVTNITKDILLANTCEVADSFWSRFCGLMLRKNLDPSSSLLLKPCNSIHMLFMRFPIDVVFLDESNRICGMCESIKPWRVSSVYWDSVQAVELPAGTIARTGTIEGDIIAIEEKSGE